MELNKEDLMNGLFGKAETSYDPKKIYDIPLDLIDDLESIDHAYEKSLKMGLGIGELAEQIRAIGQQQPAILRKKNDGRFETIVGHRRKRACILAETGTLKAIIRQCTDGEAKLISTDNLGQRPFTFPSEIAKAYKIQMEGLKQQGKRNDLTRLLDDDNNFGQQLPEVQDDEEINFRQPLPEVTDDDARDIIAKNNKVSARKVSYYLRLNNLIPDLLDMIDDKKVPIMAGSYLSYLRKKEQTDVVDILNQNSEVKITKELAKELRESSEEMELSRLIIEATVNPPNEEKKKDFNSKHPKPTYKTVLKAVEKYIKKLDVSNSEKLAQIDEKELEARIKEVIDMLINS